MTKITHLALFCAVVVIGMLIPPAMAVDAAPGEHVYRFFDKAQDRPDIDGDMIVWEDDRNDEQKNGNKDIYFATIDDIRNTKDGHSFGEQITDNPASQEKPSISGDHIVWQDNRNGNWDIYLYKRSTGKEELLTGTGNQWMPEISGNYVAWYDGSSGRTNIVLYDIAAGRVKDVIDCDARTTIPGASTEFKPALSEKYVAWVEDVDARIRYYDIAAGKTIGPVSTSTAVQCWPSLSGSLIAWEDYRNGNPDIYMTDLANPSEGERRITPDTSEQVSPAISESIIAWEDKRSAPRSIYMYDLSTGKEVYVFRSVDEDDEQLYPAVSGNTIVWQRGTSPNSNIYIFNYQLGGEVPKVTNITISPPTATLKVDGTEQFEATAFDQSGKPMTGVAFDWDSSNKTVGTIDAAGIFTAHAAGTTDVIATADGFSVRVAVTVNAPAPVERVFTSIAIEPPEATVAVDETKAFNATALDQFDEKMIGITIDWTSSNETVGTIVKETGLFTAHAPGTTTVTAFNGNISANASVTVTAEPPVLDSIEVASTEITLKVDGTEQFTAILRDQFGNEIDGITIDWTSSNTTVGTIVKETGLFTAHAPGTTTVTASADGKSTDAVVTVTAAAPVDPVDPVLERIELNPTEAALVINETKAFKATALDQDDNPMTGVAINWTSSNETVGTVDAAGLFTAYAAGTTDVIASNGDISAKAAVTVTAAAPVDPVLSEIKVTPSRATLEVGDDQRFMATAFDQNHNVISAGKVVWTSSNETVGTVDETGILTAHAAGTTTVTASADGKSAEATVTVNAAGPAFGMITVSPSAATLAVGDELEFDAIAFDRFGNIVEDAKVTWESSDESVGTINEATGLFTAVCGGTTTVTATGDGVSGTATVTVNSGEPVPTSIVITPAAITLAKGDTGTFTATAYGQNGREIPDVVIDWSCSDECVGTIELCSGSFTALDVGTATIIATAGGVTATADVEVTEDCSGVVISPSAIILEPKDEWQFSATVYDLQDNAAAPVFHSEGGAGTITPDGLFIAECEGTATIIATAGDETGTATVTVRPAAPPDLARIVVGPSDFTIAAGNNLTLTATVFDQCGEISDAKVTWTSSDESIGTIDEATGFFTALAEGEVTLTAAAEGISGSACVTVGPSLPVPTCIEVEPSTATLAPGETREFVATVLDQCDNTMDWVRVAWSCSDESVGTLDRAGLFAAFAEGSADVKARAGDVVETATVTVTAAPVPDPTPTPTPTPGGNGGSAHYDWGDGGGATGPTFSAGIRENLMSGETFTFSDIDVTSVRSVAITAADAIPRMMLTVKEAGLPSVADPPVGETYEYFDISLYWANPGEIGSAMVTFTVTADWLEDHGMSPEDVRLMRYVGGAWQSLETEVVGEEGGMYRFRATTPGFSTFVIAAAAENETVTGEEPTVTAGEETNVTTNVTTEPTTEATTVPPTTAPATPLVYAPILAPLAFLLWRRKNH